MANLDGDNTLTTPAPNQAAAAELETVAWRKHLSGAEWKVADYVLPDSEELVRKSDADAKIAALLAQLEEQRAVSARMEADAGRYRWLKAHGYYDHAEDEASIDAAIDAMKGEAT